MRVYKDKQFLVFDVNGKICKYDFAMKQAIGFSGKPVKDIKSQLSGITMDDIIANCEDKNYANFLNFIKTCESRYNISNIGSLLAKVPDYDKFEQIYSAGLRVYSGAYKHRIPTIDRIPKGLQKILRENNISFYERLNDYYSKNPDAYNMIFTLKPQYLSLTKQDLIDIMICGTYDWVNYGEVYYSYFNDLIDRYHYNAKALLLYLDRLVTFEALEGIGYILRELRDYAKMMNKIGLGKFDRYPRNFLTTHKIAARNFNRLNKQFNEKIFQTKYKPEYEIEYKDYKFICPKVTQEIKEEATNMNNCVASYIDRVIDDACIILFLRYKNRANESLVTIEVNPRGKIVQAYRKYNSPVTESDQEAIDYFNRKFSKDTIYLENNEVVA